MKKNLLFLLSIFLYSSATADILNKCAACHGKNLEKSAFGKSKIVKDLSIEEIKNALEGYKKKSYGGKFKQIMESQTENLDINKTIKEIKLKIKT